MMSSVTYYPVALRDTLFALSDYIRLDRAKSSPSAARLEDKIASACAQAKLVRPFVLANDDDFTRVRAALADENSDKYIRKLAQHAIDCAGDICDTEKNPPYEYCLTDGARLLEVSRCVLSRIMTLCFAYRVTGNEAFAQRAVLEADKVCGFKDWHESHLLDAVEMSLAVSVCVNWLCDYLTPEQTALYKKSIFEKAVRHAAAKKPIKNWYSWSKVNWNTVCYSAIGISLLVISDEHPKLCASYLARALKNMPIAFSAFMPDGVFAEGNSYWKYAMSYYTYFISTLRNAFGSDFGLSDNEGCKKVGLFPLYISSPTGVFNIGDNKNERLYSSALFWFAREYNEPLLNEYQMNFNLEASRPREAALSALWYSDMSGAEHKTTLKSAVHLHSAVSQELVTARSSYTDENSFFFAIKGGYNYINHGDLDIGSFALEANGERWTEDLGPANYNAAGYFNGFIGGGRHKNYRKRAEGHNTLVINPAMHNADQYPFAKAIITDFHTETADLPVCSGTIDMTNAYIFNGVKKLTRCFEVTKAKEESGFALTLTDFIECRGKSEIHWFMHTRAEVITDGNGLGATLIMNGKKLRVELLSPAGAHIEVMPATPLPDSPKYSENSDNTGIVKLCVHICMPDNNNSTSISLTFCG